MEDLGKVFISERVEQKWTSKWHDECCFDKTVDNSKESFCILMPPPNVTGVLHMGHLLNNTLQDVFVRRARHCNKCATWIPGMDHAGISLQVKVEKELIQSGINPKKIGREMFLDYARAWRDKHGGMILSQLKSLGVSCDFKNQIYTLNENYSLAVLTAFVELYKRGYIYRGKRIVNWCPKTLTALSDEEVIMKPQKSKLYCVRYDIVERPGQFIDISTTRPETIMGDAAIAVNPDDERYKGLVGLHCKRPLNIADIPIIADQAVDKNFGTGILKITPAHGAVDFAVAQRHSLPIIDILNPDGTLNALAGDEFVGLDRFVVREKAVEKLQMMGALPKVEEYENNVGFSERGDVPIEPRLSEQWFLKYPKIHEARCAVSKGFIKFYPKRWEKTYLHWLDNIQDWCISRQLWWGHRIPVWYKKNSDRSNSDNWHVSVDRPSNIADWEQDEDVLDTWASSWMWPLGVFGWPNQEKMSQECFQYFYPTSVLVTGPDIIFFWVARMIIASMEFLGPDKKSLSDEEIKERIPFKSVYFTGIIRDKFGRKMSKSLGNSPEPLDLVAKYGTDGLRFGILLSAPSGQDLIFNEENLKLGRNFCNKLWNAFRFSRINRSYKPYSQVPLADIVAKIEVADLDIDDHAILSNLIKFCITFEGQMKNFEVNAAINSISSFFWNEYCNWYVEASKVRLRGENKTVFAVHDIIMRQLLLLLNPFIPFITDELWNVGEYEHNQRSMQNLYCETAKDLQLAFHALNLDETSIATVLQLKEFLNLSRRLISQCRESKERMALYICPPNEVAMNILKDYTLKLQQLVGLEKIDFTDKILQFPSIQTPLGIVYLHVTQINTPEEKKKLTLEINKLSKLIKLSEVQLSNKEFLSRAPAHIIEGSKKMLRENTFKREELCKILSMM
ncbi:MAG: valine--tRNA ligase [Puniceicoccales bacterium]|jgi:valyl-tRNA synthetase|nr:valine--tRNA ligase [Puniceicoccales bacterium]